MLNNNQATEQSGMADRSASTPPWYALKVHTGSEFVALSGLTTRGYEPFLPVYQERRWYSNRIRKFKKPAFPGYLFCRFDMRQKGSILSIPAVSYAVSCAGIPVPIPSTEVDAIRKALEGGGTTAPYLQVGQRVRIQCGALTGVEGILTRVDGEDRLTVSVHLLQRSVAVRVEPDQISVI